MNRTQSLSLYWFSNWPEFRRFVPKDFPVLRLAGVKLSLNFTSAPFSLVFLQGGQENWAMVRMGSSHYCICRVTDPSVLQSTEFTGLPRLDAMAHVLVDRLPVETVPLPPQEETNAGNLTP